jgi:hypothetical protein
VTLSLNRLLILLYPPVELFAPRRRSVNLSAPCFNQCNVCVLQSAVQSVPFDFARVISRKFERGQFLIICPDPEKLERQFRETGREVVTSGSLADLVVKLRQSDGAAHFEIAVWFYPLQKNGDDCAMEELARCANNIVLIPGVGSEAVRRRPQLVECFRRFGLLPDYGCDLGEFDPGAICLRRWPSETVDALIPAVERAFARLNTRLSGLQRILRTRASELEAADRHLQEKLLKLKQYRHKLMLLKEQTQALRKSPERKVGQILLAPYRLLEKSVKAAWKKLYPRSAERERPARARRAH